MRLLVRIVSRGGRGRVGLVWLGVAVLLAVGLPGCGPAARTPTPTPKRPPSVFIDWADFLHFSGIMYVSTDPHLGRAITQGDLGPQLYTVRFKVNGNVSDPSYRAKDGDAAFLDPGTPVYALQAYAPTFRLAAPRVDRLLTLYEANFNPAARTGADQLDLAGKVRAIAIRSAADQRTELGAITDAGQVVELVAMILRAPVDQAASSPDGVRYALVFQFADGTATVRIYFPDAGLLQRGIRLPAEFRAAIERALAK